MAKIFITGSPDGLGQLAAKFLVDQGHQVVLHARNAERGRDALSKLKGAENVVVGDLSSIEETKKLAEEVNALGSFDTIIHNAGVYRVPSKLIFAVNTLAPYILTCLIHKPRRLVYLSSGMHLHGHPNLDNFTRDISRISYSDSKLWLSPGNGRKYTPMQLTQVGFPPRWVDVVRRIIFRKDTRHKRGWPSATMTKPK